LKLNDISKLTTAIECKDKDDPTREGNEEALKVEREDFQHFLRIYRDDLDQNTLYQIL
jgi:hypothetical protein